MSNLRTIADLELSLAPLGAGLGLTLRLSRADDGGDVQRGPFPVALGQADLLPLAHDPAVYGAALCAALFADSEARLAFAEARAASLDAQRQLRVRLQIPPDLQVLRWETLADPRSGRVLATESNLLLSRYLSADDYQPVILRPQAKLRALVAIGAPADAARYQLAPISSLAEIQLVTTALAGMDQLPILGAPGRHTTWDRLADSLRLGCDIFYLVAHGTLKSDRPLLYLEDEAGNAAPLDAIHLVDLLRSLDARRPRLVVLASCESAGDGYAAALAALGPQIVRAGVPVVLAMQGQVQMATMARLTPIFFRELLRDGFADQALAVARLAVYNQPDWWVPVIYSRLREGRIWGVVDDPFPAPYTEERRLDAAMPAKTVVGAATELWVQICLPSSPGFRERLPIQTRYGDEITKADVHDGGLPISFPQSPDGRPLPALLRIEVRAPDFDLAQEYVDTELLPGQDLGLMTFTMMPKRARRRSAIHVTVKQPGSDGTFVERGGTPVATSIVSRGVGFVGQIAWTISSLAMTAGLAGVTRAEIGLPSMNILKGIDIGQVFSSLSLEEMIKGGLISDYISPRSMNIDHQPDNQDVAGIGPDDLDMEPPTVQLRLQAVRQYLQALPKIDTNMYDDLLKNIDLALAALHLSDTPAFLRYIQAILALLDRVGISSTSALGQELHDLARL